MSSGIDRKIAFESAPETISPLGYSGYSGLIRSVITDHVVNPVIKSFHQLFGSPAKKTLIVSSSHKLSFASAKITSIIPSSIHQLFGSQTKETLIVLSSHQLSLSSAKITSAIPSLIYQSLVSSTEETLIVSSSYIVSVA